MRVPRAAALLLAGLISASTLIGCGNSETTVADGASTDGSAISEQSEATWSLTESQTFEGITFKVDPSWSPSSSEVEWAVYISETNSIICCRSALHGETDAVSHAQGSIMTFQQADDEIEVLDQWTTDGVSYETARSLEATEASNGEQLRNYYLTACESDTGKGFVLWLECYTDDSEQPDQCEQLFDDFVDELSYSPSGTVSDYNDYEESRLSGVASSEESSSEDSASTGSISAWTATVETLWTDLDISVLSIDDSGVTLRFASKDSNSWLANATFTQVSFSDGTSYTPTYGDNALNLHWVVDEAGSGNLITVQADEPANLTVSNSEFTSASQYNGMTLKFDEDWFLNGTYNSGYKDCEVTVTW